MPIDEALQMRPHMAHLDTTAAKPSQEVVKQEDPAEELVALQVSRSYYTSPDLLALSIIFETSMLTSAGKVDEGVAYGLSRNRTRPLSWNRTDAFVWHGVQLVCK